MRLALSLLIVLCAVAIVRGQDAAAPLSEAEKFLQELLVKFPDLQPPEWSYADLATMSDVIVIAKVQARAEIEWNDEIGGDFHEGAAIMESNRLRILAVLKGEAADEINVLTLRWKPNVIVLRRFEFADLRSTLLLPVLVPVVVDGDIVDYGIVNYGGTGRGIKTYPVEPEYLLYLRHVEADNYVAVTGQRYSGLSVRRLK